MPYISGHREHNHIQKERKIMTKREKSRLLRRILVLIFANVGIALIAALAILTTLHVSGYKTPIFDKVIVSAEIAERSSPPKDPKNGMYYTQITNVRNNGNVPCYARVKVTLADESVKDKLYISSTQRNVSRVDESDISSDAIPYYKFSKSETDAEGIKYFNDNLPNGWIYIADDNDEFPKDMRGFYYYVNNLTSGSFSYTPLMTFIKPEFATDEVREDIGIRMEVEAAKATDDNGNIIFIAENKDLIQIWNGGVE